MFSIISKLANVAIVLILVISIIVIHYYYKKNVNNYNHNIFLLKEEIESSQNNFNSLLFCDYQRIENDGLSYLKDIILFGDNEDSISFKNVIKNNGRTLVFRYSELNCMACVDKEILNLKEFMKESELEIIILASYSNMRDLYLFKRINQIPNAKVYNIKNQQLGLPIEKSNIPYYFIADTSFRTNNFFVPDKLIPKRTTKYLLQLNNINIIEE